MNCPNDNETLVMSERSGIEIDYCPKCRGVWLDRGELDKLIEKNAGMSAPAIQPEQRIAMPPVENVQRAPQEYRQDEYHKDNRNRRKHKRESFLGDIFDF